jgi:hypothetical protein
MDFVQIGEFLYFGGHVGFKMATIANQQWIKKGGFKQNLDSCHQTS